MCNAWSKIIIFTRTKQPKTWKNNKNTEAQAKLSGSFKKKVYLGLKFPQFQPRKGNFVLYP